MLRALIITAAALLATGCSSPTETPSTFTAAWQGNEPTNPASTTVTWTVTNTGTETTTADCTVRAYDTPGGPYSGFDIFTTDPIAPGETKTIRGRVTIVDEGAAYALAGEVECE